MFNIRNSICLVYTICLVYLYPYIIADTLAESVGTPGHSRNVIAYAIRRAKGRFLKADMRKSRFLFGANMRGGNPHRSIIHLFPRRVIG